MNAKQRIKRIENKRGASEKIKYLCTSKPDCIEYEAKPFVGAIGETFTFKTENAMREFFDKHNEFELLHIQIVYASEQGEKQ